MCVPRGGGLLVLGWCIHGGMARIDVNEALRSFVLRDKASEIIAALDGVTMDFEGSAEVWRYGGGRDLSQQIEKAWEDGAT